MPETTLTTDQPTPQVVLVDPKTKIIKITLKDIYDKVMFLSYEQDRLAKENVVMGNYFRVIGFIIISIEVINLLLNLFQIWHLIK